MVTSKCTYPIVHLHAYTCLPRLLATTHGKYLEICQTMQVKAIGQEKFGE